MKVKATTADAYKLLHEGSLALARAEQQGIRVDLEYCEKMKARLTRRIEYLQKKFRETELYEKWRSMFGSRTNIDSRPQLSQVLYKGYGITPPKKTKTGAGATDDEALRQLIPKFPEIQWIQDIARWRKLRDTYLEGFTTNQHNGYLHPTFNLHTTVTYRSSSSDPNFQNIPVRDKEARDICRRALYPREGHQLVEADFKSLEVMISACYHKDPVMIEYLETGGDMHKDMAEQIFFIDKLDKSNPAHNTLRSAAKNGFVFPQFYGDYYKNNADSLAEWIGVPRTGRWKSGQGLVLPEGPITDHLAAHGIKSMDDFINHLKKVEEDFWGRRFKVYHQWRQRVVEDYRRTGRGEMLTGFVFQGQMRRNQIINTPVQGTAFHCLLRTFIELDKIMRRDKWRSRLIGQIHDSIVMDVHPDELEIVQETIQWVVREYLPSIWRWIIVPLDVEIEVYDVDGPWVK